MKRIFVSLLLIFISQSVLADYITQNTNNGCTNGVINIKDNHSDMFAVFMANQHTCPSGQYLPANIDGCRLCPVNGTCSGGTYTFNESSSHGIEFTYPFTQSQTNACISDVIGIDNNNHANIIAIFTPNQHTCSAGYYLPANTDECRPCLKDNKCIGGTYSFNETTDQGIEPCPNDNKYAPSHSAVCYPRRMHIDEGIYVYLKSTPSTDPALNVNVNGTMYHANLVRNEIPMNKDTDRFLPVTINGVMYFACDDTCCPQ